MSNIFNSINTGIDFLHQRKYLEAIELFQELHNNYPDNPAVLYNYGICLNELRDFIGASHLLEKVVSIDPEYENAKVALGFSYINLNKKEEAIRILEDARKTDPDNIFLLRNLGTVYAKKEEFDNALEIFKHAETLEPTSCQALYAIALVYNSQKKYSDASRYLSKIIELDTDESFTNLAKDLQREIASKSFSSNGLRMDAVHYCLGALEAYNEKSFNEIQAIAFEISLLGSQGLDPSNPDKKYQLQSMPGEFSALHLLCYMYVGFKILKPDVDIGFDLSKEFEAAEKLFNN